MSQDDVQQELPITVFVCRRGQRRRATPCSMPSCGAPHTKLCDFPLGGSKAGKTCDAKLCDGHATRWGPNLDYCPAHSGMAEPTTKESDW